MARFGRYREDFLKDEWAMSLAGPDLPVPRVLEVGEAFGNAYAISERHVGRFLETLDEPSLCRLMPALLRALDALRLVPVSSGAGCVWRQAVTDATRWQEWLPGALIDHPGDRVSGWRAKLAATAELDHLFLAGERRLHDLLGACPELRHILHLDLLNRNVLVAEDSRSIEAVFDWGCLAFGDFLYEVAWFTFWAPWHPGLAAVDFRAGRSELRRAPAVLRATYRTHAPRVLLVRWARGGSPCRGLPDAGGAGPALGARWPARSTGMRLGPIGPRHERRNG